MLETALIFLAAAAALLVAEVFIPSGGLLGVSSLICVLIGIVMLYIQGWEYGLTATVVLLILAPFALAMFVRMWPHMPVARFLTLRMNQKAGVTNYDPALKDAETTLVGAEGKALTALRPVGTCLIDGKRIECLAATGVIEAGQRVKVDSVRGIEVKVRPV